MFSVFSLNKNKFNPNRPWVWVQEVLHDKNSDWESVISVSQVLGQLNCWDEVTEPWCWDEHKLFFLLHHHLYDLLVFGFYFCFVPILFSLLTLLLNFNVYVMYVKQLILFPTIWCDGVLLSFHYHMIHINFLLDFFFWWYSLLDFGCSWRQRWEYILSQILRISDYLVTKRKYIISLLVV